MGKGSACAFVGVNLHFARPRQNQLATNMDTVSAEMRVYAAQGIWRSSVKVCRKIKVAPGRQRPWRGCHTNPCCTSDDCDFCWCRRKKVCSWDSRTCG